MEGAASCIRLTWSSHIVAVCCHRGVWCCSLGVVGDLAVEVGGDKGWSWVVMRVVTAIAKQITGFRCILFLCILQNIPVSIRNPCHSARIIRHQNEQNSRPACQIYSTGMTRIPADSCRNQGGTDKTFVKGGERQRGDRQGGWTDKVWRDREGVRGDRQSGGRGTHCCSWGHLCLWVLMVCGHLSFMHGGLLSSICT
jgi:hypothetical protein